ncbi:PREDICTED: egg cell-secreted protein 1.1-like [Nicotiana attenuata]|uniref:egg cell-secreted protein 1.1-like n=1 Tax=Nicotiana attenuata TaxID=49451 RepID=UPI000905D7EB|nr:PREDICTED: egg cell-secreted protein 1.1-like [Nicotiana attenuata]
MMSLTIFKVVLLLTLFSWINILQARPLTTTSSTTTLLARLKLQDEEGSSQCWDSLLELQACTGEIVLFFINGETYLGPDCCVAIRTIERQCWPSMLGSIGFTSQEGDILHGYCDATESCSIPEIPSPLAP